MMNDNRRFVIDVNVVISALLFPQSQPRKALDNARKFGIMFNE
jgi:predicted nucleic acid-binding protein